jgi:PAS domain S-box-containing protein
MLAIHNSSPSCDPDSQHLVRFYHDDQLLAEEISQHLLDALAHQGAAIMIATPERVEAVVAMLRDQAQPAMLERLVTLDAASMLARLMVDGWPDAQRFDSVIGELVRRTGIDAASLHAYGEMVALLCADGHYDAAVRLEQLWNDLACEAKFFLFCAYPWRLFPTAELANNFARICQEHDHACSEHQPSKGVVSAQEQFALLDRERKAFALEAEVARREQAERQAAASEADFSDFLDNAAEGIHRVGPDGIILWANQAELSLLGYQREEYVGHHIADFHVDQPVIEQILDTLLSGATVYDQPARLRCRDGSIRHVTIHSNGRFDHGKLSYTRCFTRDATERHERDLALKQRNQMILQSPVATALLSGPDLCFELVNKRYRELTGDVDPQGKTFGEAFPRHRDGDLHCLLRQVYSSGTPFSAEELCLHELTPVPGERYFRLSLEPLCDMQGMTESVIVVAVDVTEHVTSRKKLEQARDEREALLTKVTEANRNKDQFLAMLGHELRNPLSPIVLALEMMDLRGDAATATERRMIKRQVGHLVRLVDDLLDIARVTQGKVQLQNGWLQVSEVVAAALEIASAEMHAREHDVSITVDQELYVDGDPVRLAQVVANLLINAARYTARRGSIQLGASKDGENRVRISVVDNGRGMAPEELRQAFDLFYQGARGIDRAEGGLGVGLALARRLVCLHGGHIEANSAGPGMGSEFVVTLPAIARQTAQGLPGSFAAPPDTGSGLKVLLVDDNVDATRMLGMLLTEHGHTVEICHDPMTALAKVPILRPDLMVLDIGLPQMSGHELARHVRLTPGGEQCRLIALSGYGQPDDLVRSHAAGFEVHLVKPVMPEVVLGVLRGNGPPG